MKLEVVDIEIVFPDTISAEKEQKEKEDFDYALLIKKLNKYGFFDKDGIWKEK